MPMEYFSDFDYQSFDISTINPMLSLFWTRNMSPWHMTVGKKSRGEPLPD
jgi:hypothetical protein